MTQGAWVLPVVIVGHNGAVCDAQIAHAVDPQLGVDD
jgi:hypothetical protein